MDKQLKEKPKGVFVFIDDDKDEHELLKIAMESLELNNQIKNFMDGEEGFRYLKKTKDSIFLILCDINMPKMDGLELKRMIDLTPEIKIKAIPFFFHSNSASPTEVRSAYTLGIQGYLKKADTLNGTIKSLENIIALWTTVVHPKDF